MKIWELEAQDNKGNSNIDTLSKLAQNLSHLEELRKDVQILGDIDITSYSTFDNMIEAISPILKSVRSGQLYTMGYAKIDGTEVSWRSYWCRSCHIIFVMPWELVDKASVIVRGDKVRVGASTPAEVIARLSCCDVPKIATLNKATLREDDDTQYTLSYQMQHDKSEPYVVWTIPFSLALSLGKIIENKKKTSNARSQPETSSRLKLAYMTMIILVLIAYILFTLWS